MTDKNLTVYCLVEGDSTRKAFPVPISSAKTVGELRKLIKAEKTVAFSDIDADELKLWKVSIPDDGNVVILRDNQTVKNQLSATSKLFKVFEKELKEKVDLPEEKADLPEDTIHILVERPPPGNINALCSQLRLVHQSVSMTPRCCDDLSCYLHAFSLYFL
jgi:hypothetical protein